MATKNITVDTGNGCGCITLIITAIVAWALLFGVNYKGKHYGLSCGSSGVTVSDGN